MILLQYKVLFLIFSAVILSNCSAPTVEKAYDELEKKETCRLHNYRIAGSISLVADRLDAENISIFFTVYSLHYLNNMHVDPKVLFKIHKNNQIIEDLNFQGESKNWYEEAFERDKTNKSLPPIISSPYNCHYATVNMDRKTFLKVAYADKIEILIQTNQNPAKVVILKEELEPLKEFDKVCLSR